MDTSDNAKRGNPSKWWLLFPVVLAGLCVVLMITALYYRDIYYELSDNYRSLSFRNHQLETDVTRLRSALGDPDNPPLQVKPVLTELELMDLSKKGINNPYDDLAADLTNNPTLDVPSERVLIFADATQVCLLGPERALAFYQEADNYGYALLAYEVDDSARVSWRVLSTLPL